MKWLDKKRGERIRKFVDDLCRDYPEVAQCMTERGFGDFGLWFDQRHGEVWYTAECGCLVGSAALCATGDVAIRTEIETILASHRIVPRTMAGGVNEGPVVLYLALCLKSGHPLPATIDQSTYIPFDESGHVITLFTQIKKIGLDVYDEVSGFEYRYPCDDRTPTLPRKFWDNRNSQMAEWITARIQKNLSKNSN